MWRWINPTKFRYYQADPVMDLWGDWTLIYCWGGLGSKQGGYRIQGVRSYAEGLEKIGELKARRQKRGYVAVATFKDWALQIGKMGFYQIPMHHRQPHLCPLHKQLSLLEERDGQT